LDLLIRNSAGDLLHYSEARDYNETLFVSRLSRPALSPGDYILEVAYQLPGLPKQGGKTVAEIPYRLEMTAIEATVSQRLEPGRRYRDELRPEEGMARFYRVEVPPEAKALRIDISETDGDVDLFVGKGSTEQLPFDADYESQLLLSREHLVISPASTPPLEAGTYTITVLDQIGRDYVTPFSIELRFTPEPAPRLRRVPELRAADDPVGRALAATVAITTEESAMGSGVLVSPQGHLLTNWHVVRGADGNPTKRIYVAVTEEPDTPPIEAFRARVIDYLPEQDLALLQVIAGLYGGPLPGDYRFPWLRLGDDGSLSPADSLALVGYPQVGGTGSRVSITYTRGIVSGFERRSYGRVIKTDADANLGNSGGAALNGDGKLVGIPSHVVGLDWGHVGYIQPVSALPAGWMEIIGAAPP
jgi:S1-C subfamily serine protease